MTSLFSHFAEIDGTTGTIVTILTGGVVALWKWMLGAIGESKARHQVCEEDRVLIRKDMESVKSTLAVFESCTAPDCGALKGLKRRKEMQESYHLYVNTKPKP